MVDMCIARVRFLFARLTRAALLASRSLVDIDAALEDRTKVDFLYEKLVSPSHTDLNGWQ
jgi:hypothetical protein